jgi:hypothetical protein
MWVGIEYWVGLSTLGSMVLLGVSRLKVQNFVEIKFGFGLWNQLLLKLKFKPKLKVVSFKIGLSSLVILVQDFLKMATSKSFFQC